MKLTDRKGGCHTCVTVAYGSVEIPPHEMRVTRLKGKIFYDLRHFDEAFWKRSMNKSYHARRDELDGKYEVWILEEETENWIPSFIQRGTAICDTLEEVEQFVEESKLRLGVKRITQLRR